MTPSQPTSTGVARDGAACRSEAPDRMAGAANSAEQIPAIWHFTVKTHFLKYVCYPYLMKTPKESLAYLSGVRCRDTTVIDQLVTFKMEVQTAVYVEGNPMSTADALIAIDELGYTLDGTIHCHPGEGELATMPSGIDRRHHRRLEAVGYTTLGIIMTRDWHVRFYTDRMPFQVQVLGSDAVKLGECSYRLLARPVVLVTGSKAMEKRTEDQTHEHTEQTGHKDETVCESGGKADAGGAGPAGIPDRSSGEGPGVQAGSCA